MNITDIIKYRVKELLHENRKSEKQLIEKISIGKSGYYEMWKTGDMKVSIMIEIAQFFKVPPESLLYKTEKKPLNVVSEPDIKYFSSSDAKLDDLLKLTKEIHEGLFKNPGSYHTSTKKKTA